MNFEEEVADSFRFLFKEYGFTVIENNLDKETRDYLVYASGDEIKLRFIKDRADFFLDISLLSSSERWISFYKVLGTLKDKGLITDNYKVVNKMKVVSKYLLNYFEKIKNNANALLK